MPDVTPTAAAKAYAALIEALTPSAETKAAYHGEFKFKKQLDEDTIGEFIVPWDTVKEIMTAIRARAAAAVDRSEQTPEPECTCYEYNGGHQPGCYFHARDAAAPAEGDGGGEDEWKQWPSCGHKAAATCFECYVRRGIDLSRAEASLAAVETEVAAAHEALKSMPTEPFKSMGARELSLSERIANVRGMWANDIAELDKWRNKAAYRPSAQEIARDDADPEQQ